ncbi:MAG TPA: acyl carrier protein [Flavobacteriales bacterium]|nr:hypothetical protein [Flavobacterium sp.]HRE73247.1 acyl carrier protein [Flavobacteriales bacterium]HRJ39056.1 acyl carrier protein [Flavobacteriales bacterium]
MTENDFYLSIEREIGEIDPGTLKADMAFNEIPNWSSMHFLIIIALCDIEYGVKVTGEDFKKCKTLGDLYAVVKAKR